MSALSVTLRWSRTPPAVGESVPQNPVFRQPQARLELLRTCPRLLPPWQGGGQVGGQKPSVTAALAARRGPSTPSPTLPLPEGVVKGLRQSCAARGDDMKRRAERSGALGRGGGAGKVVALPQAVEPA